MPSITLSALQTYVLDRLDGNSTFYTNTQITGALNEFIQVTNLFTGMNTSLVTVGGGTGINQILYSVPPTIIFPLKVMVSGVYLHRSSLENFARMDRNWATSSTTKNGPIRMWTPIGIRQFILYPLDSVGGRTLQVLGVIEPTLLVNSGDTVQLEDAFIAMAIDYAAHRLQLKEGGKVFADASAILIQNYYRMMKERNMHQIEKFPRYWVLKAPQDAAA